MIIFSDLHAHDFTDYKEGRLELICQVLSQILHDARISKSPVLFAGDLVHKFGYIPTIVTISLIKVFDQFRDVEIYAISGNHDQATKNFIAARSVSFIEVLAGVFPNIHCIDYQQIQIGDYMVTGVPYMTSSNDFYAFMNVAQKYNKSILLCHQTPTRLFNDFIPAQIDIDHECFDKFDMVFMGHIHRFQDFGKNRFMVGNPLLQDAGDVGDEKGYLKIVNGNIERVIIKTDLDNLAITKQDAKVKAAVKAEKVVNIDTRMYSESFSDKFTAFCGIAKLDPHTVSIGKKLIS
jgi:DNA repair exonuclease SbcCD nuclease subunit